MPLSEDRPDLPEGVCVPEHHNDMFALPLSEHHNDMLKELVG